MAGRGPHCGKRRPTLNVMKNAVTTALAVVAMPFLCCGGIQACIKQAGPGSVQQTVPAPWKPQTQQPTRVEPAKPRRVAIAVSRSQFGEKWPLTVESGELTCQRNSFPSRTRQQVPSNFCVGLPSPANTHSAPFTTSLRTSLSPSRLRANREMILFIDHYLVRVNFGNSSTPATRRQPSDSTTRKTSRSSGKGRLLSRLYWSIPVRKATSFSV